MTSSSGPVSFVGLVALSGAFGWGALQSAPLVVRGEVQILPAALGFVAALGAFRLVGQCLTSVAGGLDWLSSHEGTGKSGTALFGKYKELKPELCGEDSGPFWGMSNDKAKKLFADFVSNAYIVGPAGSGKGHTSVIPMIFLIPHSKIIMDFKPELLAVCKRGLESRGQKVISLNPFQMHTDIVGTSDQLNVLDVNSDNLYCAGRLQFAFSDSGELSMQLYPDPSGGKGGEKYWISGTQKLLSFTSLTESMRKGYDASLIAVTMLLDDQSSFERLLRSIIGIDFEGKPDPTGPYCFELSDWAEYHDEEELEAFLKAYRAKAAGILKFMCESGKQFSTFLEAAQQAMEPYGFGPLSKVMGRTSFDFDEIKSGDTSQNIFVVGDASRSETTEKFFGLTQWYMQLKLKRHPNKHVPVYLINDEINNYSIHGYISLLSWGRGFGIRTINFLQNFTGFENKHGKHATEVLNSESEIKLFLPGQRSESTIKKIMEMLGEQSLMVASLSGEKDGGALRENMSESARALMTADEIRRTHCGILFIRQQRPYLQVPVSYSEIDPLRVDLADINPHHEKPFLNKVKLKLKLPSTRGKK